VGAALTCVIKTCESLQGNKKLRSISGLAMTLRLDIEPTYLEYIQA